jgi:preprotein translocase subunit SecF
MQKIIQKIADVSAKTWLYLFLVTAVICVIGLRHNNQTMTKLRDGVYAADKSNVGVNESLNKLRSYVFAHMNTSLSTSTNIRPPIQLKYTYQRLYDEQFNNIQTANQKIYNDAKIACPGAANTYDPARLACIQNYAVNHGVKGADINIPAGLYEFDFVSPTWSPDLAGWTLLFSIVFLAAFLIRVIFSRLNK